MFAAAKKGQEAAPFELLIAVIVMAFVMLFGYRLMDEMFRMQCKATIGQELEGMRSAIESTVMQGSLERIVFAIPQCFEDAKVNLVSMRNKVVCSTICKDGRENCMALYYNGEGHQELVCVDIRLNVEFEGFGGGVGTYCEDRRSSVTGSPISYELTPFTDEDIGIPNGAYELVDRTPPGWSKKVVCAYRQESGV